MEIYKLNYCDWTIEFTYSPFFEMLCSLHVLTKPEHHLDRLIWAKEMKNNMSEELYKEILYFGHNYENWLGIMDFPYVYENMSTSNIVEAIEHISKISIENYIFYILNGTCNRENIKSYMNLDNAKLDGVKRERYKLFRDPESIRSRLIACLKEYYYKHFEKEIRYIEPLLVRTIKSEITRCEKIGLMEFIKSLHSRIEITEDAFHFNKRKFYRMPFDKIKVININISSFIEPHLLIGMGFPDMLTLTIRAHLEEGVNQVPTDLLSILKALSDETRINILRSIYKVKGSTQSLAKELSLTEACVSKHLKILKESGIVEKERKGNYIYYSINMCGVNGIPLNLQQYFDR